MRQHLKWRKGETTPMWPVLFALGIAIAVGVAIWFLKMNGTMI